MEKEEIGQEQEMEIITDSEMEQQIGDKEETEVVLDMENEKQAGDKAEASGKPTWQEVMKFMAEQFRKQEENSKQTSEKFD